MQTKTAIVVLGALVSAAAVGCGSSGSSDSPGDIAAVRASLHRAADCGSLLADLQSDALYKLNRTVDRQIQDIQACQKSYPDDQCAYAWGGGYYGMKGIAENATATDSAGAAPAAAGGTSNAASASSYSQTNVQVKGVDEADIVKNDGSNIYVLHGNAFKVVKAWPATDLKQASTFAIEGTPTEMFVANGRVVVYSQVNGADVFAKAGVTAKESYSDFGWSAADGSGGSTSGSGVPGMTTPTPTTYAPLSKITILTLDGDVPHVTGEQYFEGSYLDARRVDNHVRSVFSSYQYGPKLKYGVYDLDNGATQYTTGSQVIKALGTLRSVNRAAISGSQLSDWLPYTFVKNGDKVTAQTTTCSDFYIPNVGSTQSGMTKISSLDLGDPAGAPKETAILGQADTVYANANTMYLASRAWIEPPFGWVSPVAAVGIGGTATASPPSPGVDPAPIQDGGAAPASLHPRTSPTQQPGVIAYSQGNTHLHKFDFTTDPTFPNYLASGTVQGLIKDQFSLDEKDGNLRIATTEGRSYIAADGTYVSGDSTTTTGSPVNPGQVNHLDVLAQHGSWLDSIGNVGEIAPNESIMSVRFVGNRGYVTTFRQVDPLFVVDLANPTAPTVLAALKIPGFSEYMQPIDENHLITIGRSGTRGLQLQIFDVTDGKNPKQSRVFDYDGSEYGSSDAEYDHKAFTWFPEKGLLAFPYYSYGNGNAGGYRASLEVFRVDVNTGFSKLGSIDSTPLISTSPRGWCGGYYGPSVRRGVFLENFVYSVSYGGIVAKDANNLAAPGTLLPLDAPLTNTGYGPYGMGADISCAMAD